MSKIKALVFDWGDTLMRDFTEYKGAMVYWPKVEVMPGTPEALAHLYTRFTCCVASNAGDSNAELLGQALDLVDIKKYFHHLYTSKELGANKPEPGFFQAVMGKIAATPDECIMVGNDYQKDIASAKAVGMKTVWLATGYSPENPPEAPVAADVVIYSMEKLVKAINQLV